MAVAIARTTRAQPAAPPTLATLAQAWQAAKAAEKQAAAQRLEIEAAILEQTREMAVAEGTATAQAGDYTIKIGFSMARSIDESVLADKVAQQLPEDILSRLFVYAPKLDLRELRHLQAHEPALYTLAAQCITTKPAKPAITVTETPQ